MVTGYDPAEHGGDILPWDADWAAPAISTRLMERWIEHGPSTDRVPDLLHLFLGPALSTHAALLNDPHGRHARGWAATARAAGRPLREERAESLAALALVDPSLTARELAAHAADFLAEDLDTMSEDFLWAVGDVLMTAGSLAIDRPTLARDTATFVDIAVRRPRTIRHASRLRSRWSLPASLSHPVVLTAVQAWEDAGATPQRAAKWVHHGVWHPQDAHDYHDAGVRPPLAQDRLDDAVDRVLAFLASDESPRSARIVKAVTVAANEEGFPVSAVAEATDHIDPAVVATCRHLAVGLGTEPVGRFGLAERLFARIRPVARRAADG
ncbi:hypothetical protein DVS28_b0271 (plasmid) [Euzebya pacifica]|uniref:Uncharacterized protein n=1 Tax=Euzebya pacifica TaxID=1608957 RepID=A0A346Y6E4_9ACTN|nr:hypothetical protein [Euzebya pacifica]AXV10041.1 hypothetical protein DVS28_b0271 [Euzebya pacifica]